MTQQKVRATTLQQKFGFQDNDLSTPAHDALMVWLDQNVAEYVLAQFSTTWQPKEIMEIGEMMLGRVKNEVIPSRHNSIVLSRLNLERVQKNGTSKFDQALNSSDKYMVELEKAQQSLQEAVDWRPTEPPNKTIEIIEKVWESPILSGKYMVGFADMKVLVSVDYLSFKFDFGFPEWDVRSQVRNFLFEVKPTIPSVGELIRQIRMYQEYQGGKYVVVSPDDRFVSVLADQGIKFLKAPAL